MKKIFIILAIFMFFIGAFAIHKVFALQNVRMKDANYGMNMYTPAFPLVYEDLKEKVVKGKVEFVGYHSSMVDTLEAIESPKNRLDEKFYYHTVAKRTPASKKKIGADIKEKFNEKSSILEMVQWEPSCEVDIILYSMVKKNIEFLKRFEILDPLPFDDSKEEFKYFGTKEKSKYFKAQTKPLFYKDKNNYAISLKTKTCDEIILYMPQEKDLKEKSVHKLWAKLQKEIKPDSFKEDDKFLAPFIQIKELISYDDLSGKEIKGTDYRIAKAIESVEFSLDNEGAKLKNEALMILETCALMPEIQPRYFYFNRPFVLFIKEEGRKNPYFMVKIQDARYLIKS